MWEKKIQNHVLKIRGVYPIEKFNRFWNLATMQGISVDELIMFVISEYLKTDDFDGTLVSEDKLLFELNKRGLCVSRQTLRKYRVHNKLIKGGVQLAFTNGLNICYHLEGCLRFFRHLYKHNQNVSFRSSKGRGGRKLGKGRATSSSSPKEFKHLCWPDGTLIKPIPKVEIDNT